MAALGPFPADRKLVVAVSGGADSMALAWLAAEWGRPHAVIVDHGLRPEAAHEATLTADRLRRLGIPADIVRAGLAPGSAAAERAREARYRLLLQACQARGCADLLLAHHADDQAETVHMRALAGSGALGLAGMPTIAYRSQARLLRPLLGLPRLRLRATATAAGLAWVEDPSNHDMRTRRAQIRSAWSQADANDVLGRSTGAALERRQRECRAAADLARVQLHPEGHAVIADPIGADALSSLIWTVSGRLYPPPPAALALLQDVAQQARTLHGVWLGPARRLGPGLLLAREPASMQPPVPLRPGAVWDNRFRIGTPDRSLCSGDLSLGGLGPDATAFRDRSNLPSLVLQTVPAVRHGQTVIAVPHLDFPDPQTCRSLALTLAPPRPAAGAPFR